MEPLWTGEAARAAMQAAPHGELPQAITGVSIDTRSLQPGDLFFALADVRDGHEFVRAAFAKGASACVVLNARAAGLSDAGPLMAVADVLAALGDLGRTGRNRTAARVIGVTGSVGKTGTKEALRHVLDMQGATHASVASYNNHWGVPLTLARTPKATRFAVYEMGMSAAGEIAPLSAMARPHVGLVTTIAPVHIEFFRGIEGIADAKSEMFGGMEPGGTAIMNRDVAQFERLKAHAAASPAGRIVTFGEHKAADFRALSIATDPDGADVEARWFGNALSFRVGTAGRHNALNAMGVLAGVHALGADVVKAAADLAGLSAVVGRGAREQVALAEGGSFTLVDESFNANPASMRAALAVLATLKPEAGGRRIAVLGDMLELGAGGPTEHEALASALAGANVDAVFACGPLMKHLWNVIPATLRGAHAPDAASLAPIVTAAVRAGDVVMVKGSKGSFVSRVVPAMRSIGRDPGRTSPL